MLYNFESDTLDKQSVLNEALAMTENLCDEFSLENHFAIISLTLHELLSLIIHCDDKEKTEYNVDAIVEAGELTFQIRTNTYLKFLERALLHSEEGVIVLHLSDKIEISEDYSSICIMFHVKPKRKQTQERENTYKENMRRFLYTEEEIDEIKKRLKSYSF